MARGERTPDDQVLEFRQHYLVTGSVAGAAKAAKLPVRTGYDLAREADEDAEFAEARAGIRKRALADAEVMMLAGMQLALERMNREPLDPMAFVGQGAAKVHIQDSGPAYGKVIVDGYKALSMNRRASEGADGSPNRPHCIEIVHREDDGDDGNDPGVE